MSVKPWMPAHRRTLPQPPRPAPRPASRPPPVSNQQGHVPLLLRTNEEGATPINVVVAEAIPLQGRGCCTTPDIYKDRQSTYASLLFATRWPQWNQSAPALIFLAWELAMTVYLGLSLISVGTTSSPGVWLGYTTMGVGILFLISYATAETLKPRALIVDPRVARYVARLGQFQSNDARHFRIGMITHLIIGILYILWFYISANQSTPIDPNLNVAAYTGQQNLNTALFVICMLLFAHNLSSNSSDVNFQAVAYQYDLDDETPPPALAVNNNSVLY